jgi:hypothetical protein
MKKVITVLFMFVGFTAFGQNNAALNLQNVIDTFIINNKIPALAVAVIKLDTVLYAVSGVNTTQNGSPVQLSLCVQQFFIKKKILPSL